MRALGIVTAITLTAAGFVLGGASRQGNPGNAAVPGNEEDLTRASPNGWRASLV